MEILLQRSAGADTDYIQGAVALADYARFEIDVGERIKFGDHNLDVVGTYAMGYGHQGFALESAADSMELSRMHVVVDRIETGGYHVDSPGIAYENDVVAQLVRTEMYVKNWSRHHL